VDINTAPALMPECKNCRLFMDEPADKVSLFVLIVFTLNVNLGL
jgi:hypothetical protein